MMVSKKMLPPYGVRLTELFPQQWTRFKRVARAYAYTNEREVRVAWLWFVNGAKRGKQA